jgi:hypothetical protein
MPSEPKKIGGKLLTPPPFPGWLSVDSKSVPTQEDDTDMGLCTSETLEDFQESKLDSNATTPIVSHNVGPPFKPLSTLKRQELFVALESLQDSVWDLGQTLMELFLLLKKERHHRRLTFSILELLQDVGVGLEDCSMLLCDENSNALEESSLLSTWAPPALVRAGQPSPPPALTPSSSLCSAPETLGVTDMKEN